MEETRFRTTLQVEFMVTLLLEHDELKKTYKTTEKGLRLLELYNSLPEIVDSKKNEQRREK